MTSAAKKTLLFQTQIDKYVSELLPKDAFISKNTLILLNQCSTEFIHVLATKTNEIATENDKNRLNRPFLFEALEQLDFSDYAKTLKQLPAPKIENIRTKSKRKRKKSPPKTPEEIEELRIEQQKLLKAAEKRALENGY